MTHRVLQQIRLPHKNYTCQTSQASDAVNQPRVALNKRRLFIQPRWVKRGWRKPSVGRLLVFILIHGPVKAEKRLKSRFKCLDYIATGDYRARKQGLALKYSIQTKKIHIPVCDLRDIWRHSIYCLCWLQGDTSLCYSPLHRNVLAACSSS